MEEDIKDVMVVEGTYKNEKFYNETGQMYGGVRFGKRGWFANIQFPGRSVMTIKLPYSEAITNLDGTPIRRSRSETPNVDTDNLTNEEILDVLKKRFELLERAAKMACSGKISSLIVSSAPGTGKTYTIMKYVPEAEAKGRIVRILRGGNTTPAGLYESLWETKEDGLLIIDDCDVVFNNSMSLNLLKTALDTTDTRLISWTTQGSWLAAKGIDNFFEYHGTVVFLTNVDFDAQIQRDKPLKVHLEALMDRSFYLDLKIHKRKEIYVRIAMVCDETEILKNHNIDVPKGVEILGFIDDNKERFRFLSIRTLFKCIEIFKASPNTWRNDAAEFFFR